MNEDQVVSAVFGNTDDATKAVDHVFVVLEATYGAAWARSLGASPIGTVKTVWAFQLGQFTHSIPAKRSIVWALKNLPDAAPSAIQFRNLCRQAPAAEALQLPAPKADTARVDAELSKLDSVRHAVASRRAVDHKAWAHHIITKHKADEPVNVGPLRFAREALGLAA